MKIPPKKLKALVDQDAAVKPFAKKKPAPEPKEEEHDEGDDHDEDHEHDDEGEDEEEDNDRPMTPEEIGDMVQAGRGDKELLDLVEGIDDEDGNPPEWVEDEDKWVDAVEAVKPKWDEYDSPYGVAVHIYKLAGGRIKEGEE